MPPCSGRMKALRRSWRQRRGGGGSSAGGRWGRQRWRRRRRRRRWRPSHSSHHCLPPPLLARVHHNHHQQHHHQCPCRHHPLRRHYHHLRPGEGGGGACLPAPWPQTCAPSPSLPPHSARPWQGPRACPPGWLQLRQRWALQQRQQQRWRQRQCQCQGLLRQGGWWGGMPCASPSPENLQRCATRCRRTRRGSTAWRHWAPSWPTLRQS